jgi:hypothetical protein
MSFGGGGGPPPMIVPPAPTPPPQLTPTTTKPQRKPMSPSFIAGALSPAQGTGGTAAGKTLLGT